VNRGRELGVSNDAMTPDRIEQLALRVERLEKKNRFLSLALGFCLSVPLLALAGWQAAPDTLRVRRLEVVDERGVPLVTLAPTRNNEGGSIVLRDSAGERRSWWQSGPNSSALTLNSQTPDGQGDTTLGMAVGPKSAKMTMIGKSGSTLSAALENEEPRLDLWNAKGVLLFGAPWKPAPTKKP